MDKLGIRELLRYGYTGVLCAFLAVIIDGEHTKALIDSLGDVLAPLAALAVGAAVYLVFKTLVGDLFLWRIVHWLHGRREDQCKVRYLEREYYVKRDVSSAAYAAIRDALLGESVREQFHVQHSEGYLLFLTAFIFGSVVLLGNVGLLPNTLPVTVNWVFGAVSVVTLFAGFRHDFSVCRSERAAIGRLPKEAVAEVLVGGGFAAENMNNGAKSDTQTSV